ncbi:hypothetical protein LTR84_001516 [Exophiala bonariae]|uniref:FAD dependent oxidoreductase domain-containing protein n=1 Tax=Exophiala bonariae TaxID=1690606 RepID=A0AAV9NCP5_9EURO|nr:hypothetical protein LTR84_001516 [Exophiala bonariae]
MASFNPKINDADVPVIIVGAGVFGLSTSLHLGRRGFRNVAVFDKQQYDEAQYSYLKGCDAASADFNKIIRSAYGEQTEYQDLSTEALQAWRIWNNELENGSCVPEGMKTSDRVFINNGNLSFTNQAELPPFELASVHNLEKAGIPNTQLITGNEEHIALAKKKNISYGIDPFDCKTKGKSYIGVFDTTGGTAVADKACRVALHRAKTYGVQFVLGLGKGEFESFSYDSAEKVNGIRTRDGKTHFAKIVVIACGGWSPGLIPQLDGLCETTAGSVIHLRIPPDSPLFGRFAPENFPTWTYRVRDGPEGGLYGFARDEQGYMKIGYRGTKYTNPQQQADGSERSVPITRYTENEQLTQIPKQAMRVMKAFVKEYLPELAAEGINVSFSRLCWYTDSFDNHFVIDRLPGQSSVLVATGGSGHAFKYLPIIGNWVVDILGGIGLERELVQKWRWRHSKDDTEVVNKLMEGTASSRNLRRVPLTTDHDLESQLQNKM